MKIINASPLYNYKTYFETLKKERKYVSGNFEPFVFFNKKISNPVYKNSFLRIDDIDGELFEEHKTDSIQSSLFYSIYSIILILIIAYNFCSRLDPKPLGILRISLLVFSALKIFTVLLNIVDITRFKFKGIKKIPITNKILLLSLLEFGANLGISVTLFTQIILSTISLGFSSLSILIFIASLTIFAIASYSIYKRYAKTEPRKLFSSFCLSLYYSFFMDFLIRLCGAHCILNF